MELRGSMRVYCRIKPEARGEVSCVEFPKNESSSMDQVIVHDHIYHFDKVFHPVTS